MYFCFGFLLAVRLGKSQQVASLESKVLVGMFLVVTPFVVADQPDINRRE